MLMKIEKEKRIISEKIKGCISKITHISVEKYPIVPIIISKYDQEIPQSQTADNPMTPRERATQPSRDTMYKLSKATSSLFPIKMIAKVELTKHNV